MARKRKHPDVVERHKQQRFENEFQSPKIKDIFPEVAQIRISLTFEDLERRGDPEPRDRNYSPEDKAFFEFECPYRECVVGGFNFSGPVWYAVRDRLAYSEGTKKCMGWQDRERINKNRCYLKSHYEIHIQYRDVV